MPAVRQPKRMLPVSHAITVSSVSVKAAVVLGDVCSKHSPVVPATPLAPQTVGPKGRWARAPTFEEFHERVVPYFRNEYMRREHEAMLADPTYEVEMPYWSWDGAGNHGKLTDPVWAPMGIRAANHSRVPPRSPDMHNAIELTHATVTRAFRKFISRRVPARGESLQLYMDELVRLHSALITTQWARDVVARLYKVTLPAILMAEGDYPGKDAR